MEKPRRVTRSILDPLFLPFVKPVYRMLRIPRGFPPEGIIGVGHLSAIIGALGLAFALRSPVLAIIGAIGVAGSHIADMVDGTHARETNQCRNGGELLDHFVDPLAFSYWAIGLAVSCGAWPYGYAAVIVIFATALLTNIKAKITGEFTLAPFGSTEMRTLLVIYGILQAFMASRALAFWLLVGGTAAGAATLLIMLIQAVRQVNASGVEPDETPWELAGQTPETKKPDDLDIEFIDTP
jgi:phosphatidylglycerophosphate synthase